MHNRSNPIVLAISCDLNQFVGAKERIVTGCREEGSGGGGGVVKRLSIHSVASAVVKGIIQNRTDSSRRRLELFPNEHEYNECYPWNALISDT